MKAKLVLILLSIIAVVPVSLRAWTDPEAGDVQSVSTGTISSDANRATLTDVLSVPSSVPRGPKEVLQDYQDEMTAVTQRFSARIASIAEAVQRGQISS